MKKKYLYIIILTVFFLACAITSVFLFTASCKEEEQVPEVVETWKDNLNDIVSIRTEMETKDSGVLVYKYVKNVEYVSGNNANVTTETSTLNVNFELDTTYDKYEKQIKKENSLAINLDQKLYVSYNDSDTLFMGTVNNENINKVLNTEGLSIVDVATIIMYVNNNRLEKVVCTYKTTGQLDVVITTVYGY